MEENEVIALLRANLPIGICDGGKIDRESKFEIHIMNWLRKKSLPFQTEDTLYSRNANLANYQTIIFDTQDETTRAEEFAKILAFPYDNLKVVIVGSKKAYEKIKSSAEKFDITVILFDIWEAYSQYEDLKEKKKGDFFTLIDFYSVDHPDLFFDPKEKFSDSSK